MWHHGDSILVDFLERGDVVKIPDSEGTIVHITSIGMAPNNEDVILYGRDDVWEEEIEYTIPAGFYVPVMVYVD